MLIRTVLRSRGIPCNGIPALYCCVRPCSGSTTLVLQQLDKDLKNRKTVHISHLVAQFKSLGTDWSHFVHPKTERWKILGSVVCELLRKGHYSDVDAIKTAFDFRVRCLPTSVMKLYMMENLWGEAASLLREMKTDGLVKNLRIFDAFITEAASKNLLKLSYHFFQDIMLSKHPEPLHRDTVIAFLLCLLRVKNGEMDRSDHYIPLPHVEYETVYYDIIKYIDGWGKPGEFLRSDLFDLVAELAISEESYQVTTTMHINNKCAACRCPLVERPDFSNFCHDMVVKLDEYFQSIGMTKELEFVNSHLSDIKLYELLIDGINVTKDNNDRDVVNLLSSLSGKKAAFLVPSALTRKSRRLKRIRTMVEKMGVQVIEIPSMEITDDFSLLSVYLAAKFESSRDGQVETCVLSNVPFFIDIDKHQLTHWLRMRQLNYDKTEYKVIPQDNLMKPIIFGDDDFFHLISEFGVTHCVKKKMT